MVPDFVLSVVYFSRGTLPQKRNGKRALLQNLATITPNFAFVRKNRQAQPSRVLATMSDPGAQSWWYLPGTGKEWETHSHLRGSLLVLKAKTEQNVHLVETPENK